jgi:hypothetical protein
MNEQAPEALFKRPFTTVLKYPEPVFVTPLPMNE